MGPVSLQLGRAWIYLSPAWPGSWTTLDWISINDDQMIIPEQWMKDIMEMNNQPAITQATQILRMSRAHLHLNLVFTPQLFNNTSLEPIPYKQMRPKCVWIGCPNTYMHSALKWEENPHKREEVPRVRIAGSHMRTVTPYHSSCLHYVYKDPNGPLKAEISHVLGGTGNAWGWVQIPRDLDHWLWESTNLAVHPSC